MKMENDVAELCLKAENDTAEQKLKAEECAQNLKQLEILQNGNFSHQTFLQMKPVLKT
jgi:hypothetical protein